VKLIEKCAKCCPARPRLAIGIELPFRGEVGDGRDRLRRHYEGQLSSGDFEQIRKHSRRRIDLTIFNSDNRRRSNSRTLRKITDGEPSRDPSFSEQFCRTSHCVSINAHIISNNSRFTFLRSSDRVSSGQALFEFDRHGDRYLSDESDHQSVPIEVPPIGTRGPRFGVQR